MSGLGELIRVLHTVAGLHPDSGGPARTVTSLVHHLGKLEDVDATLATQQRNGEATYTGELAARSTLIASSSSRISIKAGLPLRRTLNDLVARIPPDIVHDHGVWLPVNHMVGRLAARRRLLRVVHTRGMLEPWALSYRALRKKLAWLAYQRRDLESVATFFATSHAEAESIRALGFEQPVAVIPNGVDLPEADVPVGRKPLPDRQRNVVFMSRIHPKKGIIELLRAWAQLRPPGWKLILAGPDEGGHLQQVLDCVDTLALGEWVEYRGAVTGSAKTELLAAADIFVLPSFSENFGVVVAEALAHGVPVISTRGTPWQGLVDHGCGWWVEPDAQALSGALSEAIALDDEERHEMGNRGRQYAGRYDWGYIANDTADVYRWLLGRAGRPDCVRLD